MKDIKMRRKTVTPHEAAEIYGLSVGTLANLRYQKRGPKYFVLGDGCSKRHKVLYFIEDIESWIKLNPVHTLDSIPD